MPQPAQAMAPTWQPPAGQPGQAAPQAGLSPQQMQQVQLVVKQSMGVLLQDQSAKMIVAKCQQGDPAQTIAALVNPLLGRIWESANGAGAKVDMVAMMVAGVQIIGTLAEMLWHADVLKSEQDIPAFVAQTSKLCVEMHNQQVGQQPPAAPGAPGAPAAPGGMIAGA